MKPPLKSPPPPLDFGNTFLRTRAVNENTRPHGGGYEQDKRANDRQALNAILSVLSAHLNAHLIYLRMTLGLH